MRAESISREKNEMERFFYNRVVRVIGNSENVAVCLVYSAWDDFLNRAAGELERCAENPEAEGFYLESAEIGAAMAKLGCRQASFPLTEMVDQPPSRSSAALR